MRTNKGNAKLTPSQVNEIRQSDESGKVIAHRMGVTEQTISLIRLGRIWKDVA